MIFFDTQDRHYTSKDDNVFINVCCVLLRCYVRVGITGIPYRYINESVEKAMYHNSGNHDLYNDETTANPVYPQQPYAQAQYNAAPPPPPAQPKAKRKISKKKAGIFGCSALVVVFALCAICGAVGNASKGNGDNQVAAAQPSPTATTRQ